VHIVVADVDIYIGLFLCDQIQIVTTYLNF